MPMMAFRRLGWFRALVAAEVLVAVCSVGGLVLLRQQVLDDELKSLSSLAQAMALQADRTLGLAATVLGDTRDELARGLLVPGTPQANELLRDRIKPLDNFRALSVFDAQGQRAATSRTEGTAMPPGVQQLD